MRLAFWRAGTDSAAGQSSGRGPAKPSRSPRRPAARPAAASSTPAISICARSARRWPASGTGSSLPTVLAAVFSFIAVNLITPRYKSEARILVDGRENMFLRPNGERNKERSSLDAEAVTSQVQLLLSRDLARDIIAQEPARRTAGIRSGAAGHVAAQVDAGAVRHRPRSVRADRRKSACWTPITTASPPMRSTSRASSPSNSSRSIPNSRRASPIRSPKATWNCSRMRARSRPSRPASGCPARSTACAKRLRDAESRVEDFRSKTSLFVGINNTTLSAQQLGELNTQLNNARALKSDAETKARLIREMLQAASRSRPPTC